MTADVPEAPQKAHWWDRFTFGGFIGRRAWPSLEGVTVESLPSVAPTPVTAKPRRKGLGPKQLRWLRTNIEPFKDMEARALAAKGGGKAGK